VLRTAGPHAEVAVESAAEKRALYIVAATFFLLAAYITYAAVGDLLDREEPLTSPVGIVLSVLSLAIMPALAWAKQRTGHDMGSRALVADAKESWVCSYLSLALLVVGLNPLAGWWWADPTAALAMLPSSPGRAGRPSPKPANTPTIDTRSSCSSAAAETEPSRQSEPDSTAGPTRRPSPDRTRPATPARGPMSTNNQWCMSAQHG